MTEAPPPDARVYEVAGLDGPHRVAAITAALRRRDPAARCWVDAARGLVAVASGAPEAVTRDALAEAGCTLRGPGRRGGIGRALLLGVLLGAGGLVGGLVLGWIVGLGVYAVNPECHRPGSCTLMAPVFAALGGLLGAPAGLVAGLVLGGRRR
ncbi:hypothetical protein [Roseomonas sp. CECT 9278]|uniref:hypothetical protein n=1 Tax=Roseomonas sp. CECT 9278 TaxID=2845823 RepID=UPI001E38E0A7|nr:hypothetical protein [Roseomonas sp. CECT 9278]CAH0208038.1 hypothetical protein ROS9278_02096 [Roseomonas sp. CECT 9278]